MTILPLEAGHALVGTALGMTLSQQIGIRLVLAILLMALHATSVTGLFLRSQAPSRSDHAPGNPAEAKYRNEACQEADRVPA